MFRFLVRGGMKVGTDLRLEVEGLCGSPWVSRIHLLLYVTLISQL